MKTKPKIIMELDDSGEPVIEVKGVSGKFCLETTKDLEKEMGVVSSRKKTTDFYNKQKNKEIQ